MESESMLIGALSIIICAALFAFGLGVGHSSANQAVVEGCAKQGSFVIDGKVYDCTQRAKQ